MYVTIIITSTILLVILLLLLILISIIILLYIKGHENAQEAFYSGYHACHCIAFQGISFPDGMVVLSGPEPGHFTDPMVWRDCTVRHDLEAIMQARTAAELRRLKLYADKLYSTNDLITAAYSIKNGPVQPWMEVRNSIMTRIRISVEWVFCNVVEKFRFLQYWRAQMIQQSPVSKYYHVALLLSNCQTCLNGSLHSVYFNIEPPSLAEYLVQ